MEINYVCSLGSFCFTASYLIRSKFRKCAYPFDFILSSPELIIDCLKDDFKLFMNTSRHKRYCAVKGIIYSNHSLYGKLVHGNPYDGKKILNKTFAHHDITNPDIYKSFLRKIERFRILLGKEEPKLFMLCAQDEEYDKNQIEELNNLLKTKTTNFHILCISMFNDHPFRYEIEEKDNIKYIKLYTFSRTCGWDLLYPVENNLFHNMIQKYYNFNIKDDIIVK
jgi:hypothetical protein